MDIQYFIKILRRRIWLILAVTLLATITTYFLVGSLPDKYKANAVLSTGIIEDRGFNIEDTNVFMQEFVVLYESCIMYINIESEGCKHNLLY